MEDDLEARDRRRSRNAWLGCAVALGAPVAGVVIYVLATLALMEYEDNIADSRPGAPFSWESMGWWFSMAYVARNLCPMLGAAVGVGCVIYYLLRRGTNGMR